MTRFHDWEARDRAVVISQDCDIVHGSYETEPSVELIRGTFTTVENGLMRHGRNPRRLQLETNVGTLIEFSIHDRWIVDRMELEGQPPEVALAVESESLRVLVDWIAKRYTRPAFPDAFNERRASSTKKIEKALKSRGKVITGIFLAISPDTECEVEQNYRVMLRVTAREETLASKSVELDLVRTTKQIAEALDACDGIVVENHEVVSEASFSLADLRFFRRWDWDYRSHSGEPGGEIAPTP